MVHVNKGCLSRSWSDIRSDGSRIESFHRHLNNIQRSQPSGLKTFRGLAFDFVHRRNIRITLNSSLNSPFVISSHGSHHIFLVDHCNRLAGADAPKLADVPSGESFGVDVPESQWVDFIKSEGEEGFSLIPNLINVNVDADLDEETRERLLSTIEGLDESDFNLPTSTGSQLLRPPSVLTDVKVKGKQVDPEERPALLKRKSDTALAPNLADGDRPGKLAKKVRMLESDSQQMSHPILQQTSGALSAFFSNHRSVTAATRAPSLPSSSHPQQTLSQPQIGPLPANLTPTQLVFQLHTGKNPCTLSIELWSQDWFILMDLRCEHKWRSFDINWRAATAIFNNAYLMKVPGSDPKDPRALHGALYEIERMVMERLASQNFKCAYEVSIAAANAKCLTGFEQRKSQVALSFGQNTAMLLSSCRTRRIWMLWYVAALICIHTADEMLELVEEEASGLRKMQACEVLRSVEGHFESQSGYL